MTEDEVAKLKHLASMTHRIVYDTDGVDNTCPAYGCADCGWYWEPFVVP